MTGTIETGSIEEIRPISHQSTNDAVLKLAAPLLNAGTRLLDLGAGEGYFSKMVGDFVRQRLDEDPGSIIAACDTSPENFRYKPVHCVPLSADSRLPFPDASFDVVCSLEVIEHVEDQFAFCREIVRVLKPGGVTIISTPNVLNLNSRLRNLHSGFATLFDPLPLATADAVHTSGHIHPVSYYYLAFALRRAGATGVTVSFDRFKASAKALRFLFWPLIQIGNAATQQRLRRKRSKIFAENESILRDLWSREMLLARSIIVRAEKPKE